MLCVLPRQPKVQPRIRVFGLERIERERRDLVDFAGLAWGGVLPSGGF